MLSLLASAVTLAALPLAVSAQSSNTSLPIVDLGYERHQAIRFDTNSNTYNFSNIRFGQAPVGDLRFREPVPAWQGANSSAIDNGSVGRICPQSGPLWQLIIGAELEALQKGQPYTPADEAATAKAIYGNSSYLDQHRSKDPRQTEDCLFLDVVVPQSVLNNARNGKKAPILFWIFGGGYTEGEKASNGQTDPTGLFAAAQKATGEEFIWVAPNYRLGALGYLAGPTLASDGTPNAAIYDQRLALEWVQRYIHLFGGDPNRVTVMGESAGGGSVMYLISAFNGLKGTKFQQAIPQSPAWFPDVSSVTQEGQLKDLLHYANVSSLDELRRLPTAALQTANYLQVANARFGTFVYGPVVDGIIAPQQPGRALLSGQFNRRLRIMSGHNANEGFVFTSPNVTTNADYDNYISSYFIDSDVNYISNTLYPPVFDGSYGYTNNQQRITLSISEAVFTCNTFYLSTAYGNQTFNYQFSVPPAFHGSDLGYTFNQSPKQAPVPAVSQALQQYITTFVIQGKPSNVNNPSVPAFPVYGHNAQIVNLNTTISTIKDPNANQRCVYWQQQLYNN